VHGLKRIEWVMGQPLLPHHLRALEDSLLAHVWLHGKVLGIPSHGISTLKWDPVLLSQGVISIEQMTLTFPSGHVVSIADNGRIDPLDLGQSGKSDVTVYLHLLENKEPVTEVVDPDCEPMTLGVYEILLALDMGIAGSISAIRLGEFSKSLEGQWEFKEGVVPPLTETFSTPFLHPFISRLRSLLSNFQARLVSGGQAGEAAATYTTKTRLCLVEAAKLRRLLINQERGICSHPFFLYQQLCEFIDVVALIDNDQKDLRILAYQHEDIGALFNKLHKILADLMQVTSDKISSVTFEIQGNTYVIDKIPPALKEAEEIYLIIEAPENQLQVVDGVKVASLARLPNVVRYALGGIDLIRRESAPFDNSFSKGAHVYSIQRGSEWGFAIREGNLGLMCQSGNAGLRCGIYWR